MMLRVERKWILLGGLAVADALGAAVAHRHGVAGEPLGLEPGRRLDVHRPAVVAMWGTGLSAPLWSLPAAVVAERRRSGAFRVFGTAWAAGALSEPVFWGRRPCPKVGRLAVLAHVGLALALAVDRPARVG
jgi:hypothetical protein